MILEIDLGNTRAKWRLLRDRHVATRGSAPCRDLLDDRNFATVVEEKKMRRVRMASVNTDDVTAHVIAQLSARPGVRVELARTQSSQSGLVNAYENPSSMGVDRWLAMLAAFNHLKENGMHTGCLVVSCGTAMTIDSVDNRGCHQGGYILPGLHLMRDVLRAGTARIQFPVADIPVSRALGTSTALAVQHGAVHALASAVECACRDHLAKYGGRCAIYVSGGDGKHIGGQLQLDMSAVTCHYIEDLVLDGLRYALP